MDWIWRKGVSMGKKILAACLVVTSAPFVVPPLAIATAVAVISSLPYCFLWVSYVCAEKLMRILLPTTTFSGSRCDEMAPLPNKIGDNDVYNEGTTRVAMSEPVLVEMEEEVTAVIAFREEDRTHLRVIITEDEEMIKESKSLLDSIRDEDITRSGIFVEGVEEGDREELGARLEDIARESRQEGELESTIAKASKGKDAEKFSNEVSCREEQIWVKMEALRSIVGYSVARSTTYSEELKALYMFTGVELPTSMEEEDQDIEQVGERLGFLMSVIGVK